MSGAVIAPPAEPPSWKKSQAVSPRMCGAILELLERTKFGGRPGMKQTALKHGFTEATLKTAWARFKKGLVRLPDGQGPEKREFDARTSVKTKLQRLQAWDDVLTTAMNAEMAKGREALENGNIEKFNEARAKVEDFQRSMLMTTRLRTANERGLLEILEAIGKEKEEQAKVREVLTVKEDLVVEQLSDVEKVREAMAVAAQPALTPEQIIADELQSNGKP